MMNSYVENERVTLHKHGDQFSCSITGIDGFLLRLRCYFVRDLKVIIVERVFVNVPR